MSEEQDFQYFGTDLEAMSFAQNYHRWILDEFSQDLGKIVAEVGAGIGNFSDFLLSTDVEQIVAFEPSANMFPELEKKFSGNDRVALVNKYFVDGLEGREETFDSIVYINVMEHIEDDVREMDLAYKALKKGGKLIIFVPALSWLRAKLDDDLGHFRRYHKPDLRNKVENAGFTINKINYFDFVGMIPWFIAFVIMRSGPKGNLVSIYDKAVVPVTRFFESFLTPPIGKNLILVAEKIN